MTVYLEREASAFHHLAGAKRQARRRDEEVSTHDFIDIFTRLGRTTINIVSISYGPNKIERTEYSSSAHL